MKEKTMLSSYLFTTEKGRYFTTLQETHITSIGRIYKTVQVTCLEWFKDPYKTDAFGTHVYTGCYHYDGEKAFCFEGVQFLESRILENE